MSQVEVKDCVQRLDPHVSQADTSHTASEPYVLVSVVMPCLNEARTLAACIEQAHAGCQAALAIKQSALVALVTESGVDRPCVLTYEIIIADNGSSDGSPEIASAHGARVVSVEKKGYGAALRGGIAAARGKYAGSQL